mmetsp:Transcript_23256/g.59402  ORF Transcript_23256/g.59402 Transcript_23256/m.59402 type:complete len:735 (-) Transcript_23256:473-2677(-)|eukprot:CAMPEP_0202865296 /NCGR_PEP_ID=MMETSP1391-20130828/5578_1 /ASSEMBLY_ACC=CAM_ASM_000867 /TAXON_ID=1034604 /ORGANISM="Chlamydomonas leiostraca, Strain SAG 11-49" /LENGTH=734 /DNA_ID=CAMNT_0049545119 /DNA_START=119 /DNA_END=2323 /DNA_ORIENTATION=+
MAAVANSFDLLVGAENTLSKKKKNKNKSKADAPAAASAPASASAGASTSGGAKPAQHGGVVDASEAKAIFERAAREAKTIGDKVKLWRDWIKQAQDKTGKGLKYKDAQGHLVEFQQVLLGSKAVEISIEGAVGSGLNQERGDVVAQLLGTFFPHLGHPHTLASLLVRLSVLIEDDAVDTRGAAQRAVHNALAAVKLGEQSGSDGSNEGASAAAAWLNSIHKLDKDIAHDQQLLQKLLQSSGGVVSKESASMAKGIYKKLEERFDLLQPGSIPSTQGGSGAGRDALNRSVEDLKRVVTGHLREVAPDSADAKRGGGASASSNAAAGIRREEQLLAQQAEHVAAQIRTLEAQLRSLRSQAAEIEDKRAALGQRGRPAGGDGGKGKGGVASKVLPASHYREELELADALIGAVDPAGAKGGVASQVAAAAGAAATAPLEYVQGGQRALELARAVMGELPAKMASCKQRLVQAEKLLKLGAKDAVKVKGDADKLMNDTLRNAEELLRGSLQIVSELNTRYEVVARVAPEQAVSAAAVLRVVDGLMADVRSGYEQVQAANRGPEAPAAPAPVPAASAAVAPPVRPVSAAPAPVSAAVAPPARPLSAMPAAPGPVAAAPVANGAPKSAFDAAAAYLAQAKAPAPKPVAAPVAAPAPAVKPAAPVRAAPSPAPAATPSAPRTWGKVATPAPADTSDDASMPSLAEAYKAAAPGTSTGAGPSTSSPAEGSGAAKKKANRQKA